MDHSTESQDGLFPYRPAVQHTPEERTTVVIDNDEQPDLLTTVSSETAQKILMALRDEPNTVSNVAERVGVSVQTVTYHLNRLEEAGIVTPVQTWYSERGKPMTVYGLTSEKLIVKLGVRQRTVSNDDSRRASP